MRTSIGAGSFRFLTPQGNAVTGPVMIEAWSGNNISVTGSDTLPWVLELQNTAGGSQGPIVALSVRSSVRVCLFGDVFTAYGYNLAGTDNPVWVRAYQVPAMLLTSNVFEQGFVLPGAGSSTDIPVPPLARTFRFDVPESQKAAVNAQLLSSAGDVIGQYAWSEQPSEGVPVGAAATVQIHNGSALQNGRIDFFLGV